MNFLIQSKNGYLLDCDNKATNEIINYLTKIKAHILGVPVKGVESLRDQLFGLEANFEELQAIDFKKGCYIGQENTARMKLKNKLRRRLLAIEAHGEVKIGDDLIFDKIKIGKILIDKPYPFALVNFFDPDFSKFKNKELICGTS